MPSEGAADATKFVPNQQKSHGKYKRLSCLLASIILLALPANIAANVQGVFGAWEVKPSSAKYFPRSSQSPALRWLIAQGDPSVARGPTVPLAAGSPVRVTLLLVSLNRSFSLPNSLQRCHDPFASLPRQTSCRLLSRRSKTQLAAAAITLGF
jgi:hypothetical protein